MKYRKKPVVIDAIRFEAGGYEGTKPILEFCEGKAMWHYAVDPCSLSIMTLEGTMTARVGDWIIKGVKGEFYPCKADIFAASYEPTPVSEGVAKDD